MDALADLWIIFAARFSITASACFVRRMTDDLSLSCNLKKPRGKIGIETKITSTKY